MTDHPAPHRSPTVPHRTPSPNRRRAALGLAFAVIGVSMATWISRTPDIRDATASSTAQMGLIIAALSAGSMVGLALGGGLVARRGGRFVVRWCMFAMATGLAVVALGGGLGDGWVVAAGLAVFGFGVGAAEIAQNVEGVAVEAELGRTVVPGLHGCFSVGICGGGLLGLAATALGVPVLPHLGAVAALSATATVWVALNLPAATGREETPAPGEAGGLKSALRVWREPRTLAIGAIALGMALAEGTANDWLPLIAVDGYGLSSASGAFLYSFFGASMAVGRFAGGSLLDRFGRTKVMVASAGLAVLGIGLVSLAPNVPLGALGVFLWGLGASLGFPVALSAAGDNPVDAARRVSAVATAGYTAFLVGPPLLGFVGEHVGLRSAILVALALVALSSLFAKSVDKPKAA